MIDIVGYITKANGERGFTIKVTSENTDYSSFTDIHDSKEVDVYIDGYLYPHDSDDIFKQVSEKDDFRRDLIKKHRSLSDALRPGDRVKCSVYIVEKQKRNGVEVPVINDNRKDVQSYADFPLWLCPYDGLFERLESDTPETLKFRKQNYYRHKNREKCEEITIIEWYSNMDKWWINKNPKIIFPILWGVRFRTAATKLWEYYKDPKNTTITRIIATISPLIALASLILNIWLFFFRKP